MRLLRAVFYPARPELCKDIKVAKYEEILKKFRTLSQAVVATARAAASSVFLRVKQMSEKRMKPNLHRALELAARWLPADGLKAQPFCELLFEKTHEIVKGHF